MARYQIRRDDHPEGNRWLIFDTKGGDVARVYGNVLDSMPLDDAEELVEALNYLSENEPALTPNVAPEPACAAGCM